ncbi:MAG: hypothetical protein ABIQ99_11050 [Thermoflexales bacterium]
MSQTKIKDNPPVVWHCDQAGAAINRLLVLLPNCEFQEAILANVLWSTVSRNRATVRLLAAVDDWSDEARIRMRVALLAAMLRESGLDAEVEFVTGADWVETVLDRWMPGDVIVSHAEQTLSSLASARTFARVPLSQAFVALGKPVCELCGVALPPEGGAARALVTWILPALVIVGSFVVQAVFLRLAHEWAIWARQATFIASSALEVALIAALARPRSAR